MASLKYMCYKNIYFITELVISFKNVSNDHVNICVCMCVCLFPFTIKASPD